MQADLALWQKTLQDLQIAKDQALAKWPEIEAAHTAPNRHYHTLDHLSAMFRVLDDLGPPELPLIRLAVWFHDLVYDVSRADNEAQSAIAATEFAAAHGFAPDQTDHLDALIRSTAKHDPLWDHSACFAMLDADLSVLAADPDVYDAYADAIRREYALFPDEVYEPGRKTILQGFLRRDRLYFTDAIRADWTERARGNIARELERIG